MADVFVSKVRPVGTSLGIIIPKEIVREERLKPGKEVRLSIVHRNFKLLDGLMGTMKGAKSFERDRRDRPA